MAARSEGEAERLRRLLARLEWARTGFCPTCNAARGGEHDPGCELNAELTRQQGG